MIYIIIGHSRSIMKIIKTIPAGIILAIIFCNGAWAQTVTVREHKEVPISRNTKLRIIRTNGIALWGQWHMETSDAICLKLRSGREIIIPKDDISELYECKRNTNFGFFVGTLSGVGITVLVSTLSDYDDQSAYLTGVSVVVASGLIGAIIGSMIESHERISLESLSSKAHGATGQSGEHKPIGLRLSYRF
jgi:hypothetical protein